MRPDVALLNCSHNDDDAHRNFRRELEAVVYEYAVTEGEFPADRRDFDAVVVSGSRASVYDDDEWIDETKAWVEDAVGRGLPVLGVCFGHQLLAEVLGGTVESMDEFETGFHEIHRRGESVLFEGVEEWFTAFTVHSDEVTDLPEDAVHLASNNRCAVQAFRRGNAFGVQFHPEFDLQTAKMAMEERDVDPDRIEEVLETLVEDVREYTRVKTIFDNFCELALDHGGADRTRRRGARAQ